MLSVGDFLGAVSRSCALARAVTVTRWRLKSNRVGTLVLSIEETRLPLSQPLIWPRANEPQVWPIQP